MVCHRSRTNGFSPQAGRSFRVNAHIDCQTFETSAYAISFFAFAPPFPDKISAQPTPPPPALPEYADSSASGNYTYYFRFCNAVSGQGSSCNTAPSRAKKPAYVRHCPANPNFLKTLLLFNTSQCFFVQNLCLCNASPYLNPYSNLQLIDSSNLQSRNFGIKFSNYPIFKLSNPATAGKLQIIQSSNFQIVQFSNQFITHPLFLANFQIIKSSNYQIFQFSIPATAGKLQIIKSSNCQIIKLSNCLIYTSFSHFLLFNLKPISIGY
jgi:hypothetical protein